MQFAAIFGGVIVVAVLVGASTSTAAFGAYNTAWDGTADLRALADNTETTTRLAQNTTAYTELPTEQTVALVLAPDQAYQHGDTERIAAFVRNGGTLVVADERAAPTNDLLAKVGADARITGAPLRDERRYYRAPSAPIVRNLSTQPPLTNVSSLTLNHGTAVAPGNATVGARTSGYAYLDTNGNQNLDETETVTDYPVLTTEQVGQGEVIVIGDASLFINSMLTRPGNQQFAHNLLAAHDHLLLDYSHTATLPPLIQAMLLLRQTPILRFLGGALGVLILILLYANPDSIATVTDRLLSTEQRTQTDTPSTVRPDSSPVDDTDLVAHLQIEYPDWDDDRIERIVAARRADPTQDEIPEISEVELHDTSETRAR